MLESCNFHVCPFRHLRYTLRLVCVTDKALFVLNKAHTIKMYWDNGGIDAPLLSLKQTQCMIIFTL